MKLLSLHVLWSVSAIAGLGMGGCLDETEVETATVAHVQSSTVFLDQGWDAATRAAFYQTTQGSRMLPYEWFLRLEQATSTQPFRSPPNMRRMGFLVDGESASNPRQPARRVREG